MKTDWKSKLTSRKFWAAIIGFVAAILFAFNVPEPTAEQITAVVTSVGALVAYIFAEGYVDGKRSIPENEGEESE